MKYSFTCPGCSEVLTVEAENDDGAVNQLMEVGASHTMKVHADDEPMANDVMHETVRTQMTKEEEP